MKLISWNVNGLRACIGKGFMDFFNKIDADVFCLQETKLQPEQISLDLPGYHQYWNSAVKKGYSGTAVFCKEEPLSVAFGIGIPEHDTEGRVITAEFEKFYLINVYTPNAQRGLTRLDYRMKWEDDFRAYCVNRAKVKPVIICGDMNVAHNEIDLKNPKSNVGNAGFSPEEREQMTNMLNAGFIDTFRHFYPTLTGAYTWWSYMYNARANNAGWRIDYFLASNELKDNLVNAGMHQNVFGSDHCPVELEINI